MIKNRKTVYSFSDKPIKEDTIIGLLDAARLAPTAGGIHEYEFIAVSNKDKKYQLSQICLTPNIDTAPFIIVIFCDPEKLKTVFGDEGESVFCVENAALAIENILLYAAEQGLGSAWIATVQQDAIKKLLEVPARYIIRGVIPIGYPSPEGKGVYQASVPKLREITHIESFNNKVV